MKWIRIIEDGQRAGGEESPGGDDRPAEPTDAADAVTAGASVAQAGAEADQQSGDDAADASDFAVEPEHCRGRQPDNVPALRLFDAQSRPRALLGVDGDGEAAMNF